MELSKLITDFLMIKVLDEKIKICFLLNLSLEFILNPLYRNCIL